MPRIRNIVLLALLLALVTTPALGCKSNGKATGRRSTPASTEAPSASGPITLTVLSPADGSTVSNPIPLQVQATGIQIAPASEQAAGAAHFHAFIDKDPVAEGEVIPSGAGIFHFTDSLELRGRTGDHKAIVVLGDNNHVRLRGAPTAEVNFTIGQ